MRKFWLMARHEYSTAVRRRSFLLSTLGLPALFVIIMGLGVLTASPERPRPAGVVDRAGILDPRAGGLLVTYPDEASARVAMDAGDIGAYYVLPPDYLQTGAVSVVYAGDGPDGANRAALEAALRSAFAEGQPEAVRKRLAAGNELIVRSADGRRELSQDSLLSWLVPLVAAALFSFSTMNSAGYMVRAVASEKENRTVEVLASSLTPFELIGGKAIGLMAVALTQLLIWLALAALPSAAAVIAFGGPGSVEMPWGFMALAAIFFLPAFALIAGVMTAIGSIVDEAHQGQQIAGTLNLMFIVPLFFIPVIFANPGGPLMVAMTLFPTTAYLTVLMRWAVTVIPAWQLALSFVILTTCAALSVWAASRIFRSSMLRYGQPISLRTVWRNFLAPG